MCSTQKVDAHLFFDIKGIVMVEWIPRHQNVNLTHKIGKMCSTQKVDVHFF